MSDIIIKNFEKQSKVINRLGDRFFSWTTSLSIETINHNINGLIQRVVGYLQNGEKEYIPRDCISILP